MRPMPKVYFDERIAARYDADAVDLFQPSVVDPVVGFVAGLAGDGGALEFGIGTGRIALPLSQRGVRVHGIDVSAAMAAQLRPFTSASTTHVSVWQKSAERPAPEHPASGERQARGG